MRATDILKNEHRVIEQVLNCLEKLTEQASATGILDAEAVRDVIDFMRHFADGCHHAKEEQHLFAALESHGMNPQQGPTEVMRLEHERGREYLRGMEANLAEAAAGNGQALVCFARYAGGYIDMLRQHIWKEDHRLFPMADQMLSHEEQTELVDHFEHLEHHKMGTGTHEHFLELANRLAERFNLSAVGGAETKCACLCKHQLS